MAAPTLLPPRGDLVSTTSDNDGVRELPSPVYFEPDVYGTETEEGDFRVLAVPGDLPDPKAFGAPGLADTVVTPEDLDSTEDQTDPTSETSATADSALPPPSVKLSSPDSEMSPPATK